MGFNYNGHVPETIIYNGHDVQNVVYKGITIWTKGPLPPPVDPYTYIDYVEFNADKWVACHLADIDSTWIYSHNIGERGISRIKISLDITSDTSGCVFGSNVEPRRPTGKEPLYCNFSWLRPSFSFGTNAMWASDSALTEGVHEIDLRFKYYTNVATYVDGVETTPQVIRATEYGTNNLLTIGGLYTSVSGTMENLFTGRVKAFTVYGIDDSVLIDAKAVIRNEDNQEGFYDETTDNFLYVYNY